MLPPAVLSAQTIGDPVEQCPIHDRAFAADAVLGYVEHPVQADLTRPALLVPPAGSEAQPVPLAVALALAGEHEAQKRGRTLAADDQHGPILALSGVLLEGDPGPHHLAGIGLAVQGGCVFDAAGAVGARSGAGCHGPPATGGGAALQLSEQSRTLLHREPAELPSQRHPDACHEHRLYVRSQPGAADPASRVGP